ncbi:thermonuclease family protein [Hwanghaeella sp.]|uniref:thermonuclease family protein n=1 Tax=Hwanghaeella sp. TaxID=2605943 RepID=UPI003CCC02F2
MKITKRPLLPALLATALLGSVSAEAANKNNGAWIEKGDDFRGVAMPIDGDSLYIETDKGRVEVRLYGIGAPEYDTPFGPFATRLLHRLSFGKEVVCTDTGGRTHYRIVARCKTADISADLGGVMIQEGAATPYRSYLYRGDRDVRDLYFRLEGIACNNKRGLWQNRPDGICGD